MSRRTRRPVRVMESRSTTDVSHASCSERAMRMPEPRGEAGGAGGADCSGAGAGTGKGSGASPEAAEGPSKRAENCGFAAASTGRAVRAAAFDNEIKGLTALTDMAGMIAGITASDGEGKVGTADRERFSGCAADGDGMIGESKIGTGADGRTAPMGAILTCALTDPEHAMNNAMARITKGI